MALFAGGVFTCTEFVNAANATAGPVCPADAPCLYSGKAVNEQGVGITITVHRLNNYSSDLVAKFSWNGETQTVYVFPSGIGDGKWYFSWDGKKYWFSM